MPTYVREDIHGTTPQDINKINNNMMSIWNKVFGDVNFADADNDLKKRICTQYIQVQEGGNFDVNNSLWIRFYVPPDVKKVESTGFNFILERYKMDSGITMGGGGVQDVNLTIGMANSSITASVSAFANSSGVQRWAGWYNDFSRGVNPPNDAFMNWTVGSTDPISDWTINYDTGYAYYNGIDAPPYPTGWLGAPCSYVNSADDSQSHWIVDLAMLNHYHDISHSHNFVQSPHTHSASASITLPPHSHDLKEAIQISSRTPDNVSIILNGVLINNTISEQAPTLNNVDRADLIHIGEWNTIEVTTSSVARISCYGTIKVIQNYFG